MTSHIFQQFAFITVIICSNVIGEVSNKDESIFLRHYVGTTLEEYIDYPLKNASMIPSRIKNKPTMIYMHGFTEHVEKESVQTVVKAYLQRQDHNVIAMDYGTLVNGSYLSVAMTISYIGEALAKALNQMEKAGLNTKALHLIGHSLGSHIIGFISRYVNFRIPRITGLDPAGPLFNYFLPHLSSSNADFVDIIHTDYGGYGIGKISGTVDFFPNGGKRVQPGCPHNTSFMSTFDFCSHHCSWKFFAESVINESAFLGVQCPSLDFTSDKCDNVPIAMGYATPNTAKGIIYLVTNNQSPFGLKEKGYKLAN